VSADGCGTRATTPACVMSVMRTQSYDSGYMRGRETVEMKPRAGDKRRHQRENDGRRGNPPNRCTFMVATKLVVVQQKTQVNAI